MTSQLTFAKRLKYETTETGIPLEVVLRSGDREVPNRARVDTGANVCLFSREIGEALGIDVESGVRLELRTLVGSMAAYGHEITLETLGLVFHTVVYFSQSPNLPRNLLGREGWLRLVRVGIVDYDSEMFLSAYDDLP